MSFGKSSAPSPPNYGPIAAADAAAAQQEFQLGEDQLQWGKSQFNTVWPYAQQYLASQINTANTQAGVADTAQKFYEQTYKPIEQQFASEAMNYNSPARAEQNAGMAMTDVSNQFNANRQAALSNLESYGVDPSQTRYAALDMSTRISQAAAEAAAGTQSRLNTEATGLALQGAAINTGRGYPSAVAQSYATATNSGRSGIYAANNTIGTGASVTGTPTSYFGLSNNSRAGQASALNYGYNNSLAGAQFNAQQSAMFSSGIGNLIGGGISLAGGLL